MTILDEVLARAEDRAYRGSKQTEAAIAVEASKGKTESKIMYSIALTLLLLLAYCVGKNSVSTQKCEVNNDSSIIPVSRLR